MINKKAAELFNSWEEALIWSHLQGYMGIMTVDDENNPQSAIIDVGDFCFCAGAPNEKLLSSVSVSVFKLIIPKDETWHELIENVFNDSVKKTLRYAIKKEDNIFDKEKLTSYIASLDSCYELKLFDEKIFNMALAENWSRDLCCQFKDYNAYKSCAIGTAILHNGVLVAGASPYAVFNKGIEIEIDTKSEYQNKGLATVCGAKLILECLANGIYPSWDAHDLRSVHLAEKLGYHLSHPYVTYELTV